MRHIFIFGLFVMTLVCVQIVQAQIVDEVIGNHIEAMGGEEKLLSLKTVRMKGSMDLAGVDVKIATTVSQGIGARTDLIVTNLPEGFQILTPTKG